jgi:hypothetical protein
MPVLDVAAATATIGSFVFSGIGLSHLLNDSVKHPSTIVEEAKEELSDALSNLDSFQGVIQDDVMVILVDRYNQ